jgi:hypothetical protein
MGMYNIISRIGGRLRSAAKLYRPSLAKNAVEQKNLRISESGWAQTASTSLLHCAAMTISYLCQAAAIISALLNLNTPYVYELYSHTQERRLNRSLTNIMRAFCARGAAAPNEKKKIMNGCCWCFFSSSSISFFRHASLDAARDATLRRCAVYIISKTLMRRPCVCFVTSALAIVYFFVDRNTVSQAAREVNE